MIEMEMKLIDNIISKLKSIYKWRDTPDGRVVFSCVDGEFRIENTYNGIFANYYFDDDGEIFDYSLGENKIIDMLIAEING